MKKTAITIILILALSASVVLGVSYTKTATLQYDGITIFLKGEKLTPKDAVGQVVEPFIINGTTYLPIRAVAEALDLTVGWDGETKTITLSSDVLPTAPFTLSTGQYVVGDDIPAGKYDCEAVSGGGNFTGSVAALGWSSLNEILGVDSSSIYTKTYSNLRLAVGDTIKVSGDLEVRFVAK
jgi:hypothetical protein